MTSNRFPTRSVRVAALLVPFGILAVAAVGFTTEPETVRPPVRVLTVQTASVTIEDGYLRDRRFLGQVEPGRRAVLGFQRLDRVVEVLVDEGDRVTRGTVLARLDVRELEARRQELESALASARAELSELQEGPRGEDRAAARAAVQRAEAEAELARATERRIEVALEKAAVSAQRFDEARLARESAEARVIELQEIFRRLENGTRPERLAAQRARTRSLEARLAHNALEIEESQLVAPFDGTIAARRVDEGSVVSPGAPVLEITGQERLEFRMPLPRNVVDGLEGDHPFQVGSTTVRASLYGSLPERTLQARTVDVLFRTDQLVPGVRPGDLVTLSLDLRVEREGFWIPTSALSRSLRGLWSCYVVQEADPSIPDRTGQLERRELRVLHVSGDRSYVVGAVASGEEVVVNGVQRLVPGQMVAIQEARLAP